MASTASQKTKNFKGDHLSIKMINAKGDAVEATDFAISVGSYTLTSAAFTSGAVAAGMVVSVAGAGAAGAWLTTTIAAVESGSVTLTAAAATTVSNAGGVFGTDNAAAFAALLDICGRKRTRYFLPSGWYLTTSTFDIQTSLEIVGHGHDNQASSVIVYVGTGDGIYVHPATPGTQRFAVNMHHVAVNTYGGCQSAVKLESVSEGKYEHLSVNNSNVAQAAINLDLINPNILSFEKLIATRATNACVRIYSLGFPESASQLTFTGKNLYKNNTVFDIQANGVGITVQNVYIEQFNTLFKCDRSVGAVDLQINHLDCHGNYILGGVGDFPTCKLFDFNIPDTTTLIAKLVSFRHNWVYFGAAQENPINLTFGTSTDADMDWEISHNEFSHVDTSLMHAENVNVRVLYVQNIKRFGDEFVPLSVTSTAALAVPVYGGNSLLTANRIPHVAGAGRIASDDGLLYYGNAGEKTLEVSSDNTTDGQLRVGVADVSRVFAISVPTATYTVLLKLLGALGAIAVDGLMTVGSDEQPTVTLFVHNASTDGHTQLQILGNAADGSLNALLNILTSAGAAAFQVMGDGTVYIPLISPSKPMRVGPTGQVTSGPVSLTSTNDADVSGLTDGALVKRSGSVLASVSAFSTNRVLISNGTGAIDVLSAMSASAPMMTAGDGLPITTSWENVYTNIKTDIDGDFVNNTEIANYVTFDDLTAALAGYVTSGDLLTALGTKSNAGHTHPFSGTADLGTGAFSGTTDSD